MKRYYFGVQAEIVGDFVLTGPIKTQHNKFQVSIFIENGKYKISVVKAIPAQSPLELDNTYSRGIPPEETEYQDYILMLKHIAALGGFHYGISKILYRDTLELVWYEGEYAFQELRVIYSIQRHYPPSKKRYLSDGNLTSLFIINKIVPDVLIPYNYFREASSYFNNEEYRQAYLHFYMLLEFCFSNGATGIKKQVEAFENSIGLKLALLETLKLLKSIRVNHYEWIKNEVIKEEKIFSVKTTLRTLYNYRGRLAHGFKRSAPYVFDDKKLRPITFFINQICFFVCGNMQVYCMSSNDSKNKRMTERIDNLKFELDIS